MPERQSMHPDNKLIDELTEGATPSQQGSADGEVNRRVGKRDEKKSATEPAHHESVIGSDNPEEDARKGPKTIAKLQKDRNNS